MNKILLLFFLVASTINVKAQSFTLTELISMVKMNVDDFDTYVSNKGYKYFDSMEEEYAKGTTYSYNKGASTKATNFITLYYEYFKESDKNVTFQTAKLVEYQKIKNQIKALGFVFVKTFNQDSKTFLNYEKGKYELAITLSQTEDQYGIMQSAYEISLTYDN